jgi:enoyl-CoA hydratase
MAFEHLEVEVSESIATVWLSRPPVNAVHTPMYDELYRAFSEPDQLGEDVRVIVLAGRGKHFCAGNDLDEFATMVPANARERQWHVREAFYAIQDCPVPVIGAVQGSALGTGLALAASCDYVIAAENAKLGLPEMHVGVMGGARHLGRWVSQPVVRRSFLTGEPMTAAELYRLGAILDVVPVDDLLAAAREEAALIARHSPTAVRVAKRGLNVIEHADVKSGYTHEQSLTVIMSGHPDSKEALAARAERRDPNWAARSDVMPPPSTPAHR